MKNRVSKPLDFPMNFGVFALPSWCETSFESSRTRTTFFRNDAKSLYSCIFQRGVDRALPKQSKSIKRVTIFCKRRARPVPKLMPKESNAKLMPKKQLSRFHSILRSDAFASGYMWKIMTYHYTNGTSDNKHQYKSDVPSPPAAGCLSFHSK